MGHWRQFRISVLLAGSLVVSPFLKAENLLDVLILYTERIDSVYGGEDGVKAQAIASIADANLGFQNSGVDVQLVLRAIEKIDYVESQENFRVDLDFITESSAVTTLRDEVGADLVCLFRNWLTADEAGRAWVLSDTEGNPSTGYSIVSAQLALSGHLFSHEIGHNLGGAHDRENVDAEGIYSYSYGYRFTGADSTEYRTIMAYAPGERINYFSNPDIDFQGVSTGVAEGENAADNARTFNQSAPVVNRYREHIHLYPVADAGGDRILEDLDGDGYQLVRFDASKSIVEIAASWEWSWSGGSASGPSVVFDLPLGQNQVTLKITDSEGFTSEDVVVIEIRPSSSVVGLEAGGRSSFYIKGSGFAFAFGSNDDSQLGLGASETGSNGPREIPLSNVMSIASGDRYSLFRLSDGSVWGVGSNDLGQVGAGEIDTVDEPQRIFDSGVETISTRSGHALFLLDDGSLWGSGWNEQGQLGSANSSVVRSPVQLMKSGVRAVTAGADHSSWIDLNGAVWTMGSPSYWQLGIGSRARRDEPVQVISGGALKIEAGRRFTAVLMDDGSVRWYGTINGGRFGEAFQQTQTIEARVPMEVMSSGVSDIAVGDFQILFLKEDGSLWVMGENWFDLDNLDRPNWAPYPVRALDREVVGMAAGEEHFLVLREDRSVWSIGANDRSQLGDNGPVSQSARKVVDASVEREANVQPVALAGPDIRISNGDGVKGGKAFLDGSGSSDDWQVNSWRWSWNGKSVEGRLLEAYFPNGETRVKLEVFDDEGLVDSDELTVFVSPQSRVLQVDTGFSHTLLLKEDGSLWSSGSHRVGQLGIGPLSDWTPDHFTMFKEFTLVVHEGVRFIRAFGDRSFFVMDDGSLWAMGQIGPGLGSLIEEGAYFSPQRLIESGVKELYVAEEHYLILMKDGSLWGIGSSQYGQLGIRSNEPLLELVPIVEGGVVSACAYGDNSLYTLDDGSLWGMGKNDSGQLGDGTTQMRVSPVKVRSSGIANASLAETYSLIVGSDKKVYATGRVPVSSYLEERSEFLEVTGVKMAKAYDDHYLILREDGVLIGGGRHSGWSDQRSGVRFEEGLENPTEVYSAKIRNFVSNQSRAMLILKDGSFWGIGRDDENSGVFGNGISPYLLEMKLLLEVDFDAWLERFYSSEEIAAMGDVRQADPDEDGISNEKEIEWNLDPSFRFDPFKETRTRIRVDKSSPAIEVKRFGSGLDYNVWTTKDFIFWESIDLSWYVEGNSGYFVLPGSSTGFFRINASE